MRLAVVLLVALVAAATRAAGQEPTPALADFVARARAGSERFQDPDVARVAGYRPMGPDFPSMGRHWVHPALILRQTPDPGEPPILEYAEIAGRLTLVGVAYATLVRDGPPPPPAQLPVPADAWHFHQGTVTEESFLRGHAKLGHREHRGGPRLAVLHAWIWLDNPDGLLATDNWALPYARLGYSAPTGAPHDAARALALAAGDGGRAYVEAVLRAVGRPSVQEMQVLSDVVARHRSAARGLLAGTADRPLPLAALEHCWSALWEEARGAVRPEVWERLQAMR